MTTKPNFHKLNNGCVINLDFVVVIMKYKNQTFRIYFSTGYENGEGMPIELEDYNNILKKLL